ncbi:MAG: N-acetylmuramoyl-L-alanine amidase [Clostridium sp.]|nr:N-acetylmuramoyl-L-alanine amidase [Clostridium sp.]
MINIVQQLCPEYKWNIKCPCKMTAEYITVHNTDNDAPAKNEITYMNNNNNKVSYHYAVDDIEARQGIPLDRNTWNAGDGLGDGNMKSIAIEICYSASGGDRFHKAEDNAAQLIAYLLIQRGWGIDRVRTHKSWSGKDCPHRTMQEGWQRFLDMIQYYLNGKQPEPSGGDEEVRVYQNGTTSEPVYADTDCTKKIGSLDPHERCDCFGIFNDRAMVRYQVGSSNNYKIGFCKWLGGVK